MSSRLRVLLLVALLVSIGSIALAIVSRTRQPIRVTPSRVALVWDVPDDIDETPPTTSSFTIAAFRRDRPSLWEVTRAIRAAAEDDNVRALVLHVGNVAWGWGKVSEMRGAIAAFRQRGKPVYVSLQGGSDQSYLLASRADCIAMPPTMSLYLDGLTASALFFRGAYDKLGVAPNFEHVGQFKSAVERYTRSNMSEPSRLALEALLDDHYRLLLDSLAASRGTAAERMRSIVDEGPFIAREARIAGLVDTLLDEVELDSLALRHGPGKLREQHLARYAEELTEPQSADQIALIPAVGTIVPGRSHDNAWSGPELGSETLISALREARQRRSVRAIVMRIDSPGGSGDASDDVWREIRRTRKVKPVVVSMSNLAASGGYYIACGADEVLAEPGTITGSIGVFGGKLNVIGLYRKLGLNVESLSRGRHAEMMSPFRDFSPEESARFRAQLVSFYRVFIGRVAEGRGMTTIRVDSLGQGRVWSGMAARELGLVDSLGGLSDAIGVAKRRSGLGPERDVAVVLYPRPRRLYLQRFLGDLVDEAGEDVRLGAVDPVIGSWLRAARFPAGAALALMPYSVVIR